MFKKILLATDGSPASTHAAELAVGLARTCGARMAVGYVVDPYPNLGVRWRLAEDKHASEGILQAATEEGADLIVVGSHGRTGIGRMLLGSIAAKVVSQSPVPVLVAREAHA